MLRSNIYLTDVNPKIGNGLNHQLWCIVDALMIGEYASRNIMVTGLYPDYDSRIKLNLSNIIDIDRTNDELQKHGFSARLLPYDSEIPWTTTAYTNPVFNKFVSMEPNVRFYKMIEALEAESHIRYVNLWTTFVWPFMAPYGNVIELHQKAIQVFKCLTPSPMIRFIVNQRLKQLKSDYYVVHLRLEDDWIRFITQDYKNNIHYGKTEEDCTRDIYNDIVSLIDQHMPGDNEIYIATGLNNGENKNKYILDELKEKYPNRLAFKDGKTCEWSEIFPGFDPCREIEGYIDLHVCLHGKIFIGSVMSSFSTSLKYCYDIENKPVYQYNG